MRPTYIRSASDYLYYSIMFLATFICVAAFWFISYLDYVNMLNNGYKDQKAIFFKMEALDFPVHSNAGKFILFQYDDDSPALKHVWVNGELKLPPIKRTGEGAETDKIAVMGTNAEVKNIPNDYKLIGYFNTPYSYKLNSEIWLLSKNPQIELVDGKQFVFISPSRDVKSVFNQFINGNNVEIINAETNGSYILKSNQVAGIISYITILFMTTIFCVSAMIWIKRKNHLLSVLYLFGYSYRAIYRIILRYYALPYILFSSILFTIFMLISYYAVPLWDVSWMLYSVNLILLHLVLVIIFVFYLTFIYTVKKGGKRF
ncbi:hypothetical protein YDYSY3_47620 [Paenibacillus chitinolyticus]|nr:hypothetical protein YDYSY3_47620 [Paenibacillus chitinolyticus]